MKPISNPLLVAACACALGLTLVVVPQFAAAQISASITIAPPALPVYEQPVLAEEGGIWVPGYWAYSQDGYFWVPGSWEQPPEDGMLWTPGYWGWGNGGYAWNAGYWGTSVGFYGGINYGFGYSGHGYTGGHWQGRHFYYNTAVSRVNAANIHNTYSKRMVNNTTVNRVSFNGGHGGHTARPTAAEQVAARAPHHAATAAQEQHRQQRAPVHAADLPARTRLAAQTSRNVKPGNAGQREQETLRDNQEKQRQDLQKSQAADHEREAKQASAKGSAEELERQHQSQTHELVQRHATEQRTLQETQAKRPDAKREGPHTK